MTRRITWKDKAEHQGRYQLSRIEESENTGVAVKSFKRHLNHAPVGVKFYFVQSLPVEVARPRKPLRYCEAVNKVMENSKNILLTEKDISCPVAKEVLGFNIKSRGVVGRAVEELLENKRFNDKRSAYRALRIVPRIRRKPKAIILSSNMPSPDIFVLYLRPAEFMTVTQAYQRATKEEMSLSVSSVMPVCGNCTARPFVTGRTCISFGCPDCREYGGLSDDQLAVGMPFHEAKMVARSLEHMKAGN